MFNQLWLLFSEKKELSRSQTYIKLKIWTSILYLYLEKTWVILVSRHEKKKVVKNECFGKKRILIDIKK